MQIIGKRHADGAGHEVLELPEVRVALRQRWGERVFSASGGVNRAAVAAPVSFQVALLGKDSAPDKIAAAQDEFYGRLEAFGAGPVERRLGDGRGKPLALVMGRDHGVRKHDLARHRSIVGKGDLTAGQVH